MREPKRGKDLIQEISTFAVPQGAITVWHLNQHGYVFKHESLILYIDPYLSDDLVDATWGKPDQHTKLYEPLVQGADIDNADYVLCTHDHMDHLDPTAVKQISESSPQAKFIVPLHAKRTMARLGIDPARILYIQAGETLEMPGIKVRAFKGAHETFDYDDELGYAYLGFHISMGDYHLYHAGDTILFDELVDEVKRYPVDLAFLPINGREYQKLRAGIRGNMNYKEAAQFASEINADIVFPSHWGMHPENTEHPGHFVDYSVSRYRYQKIRVMVPGDRLVYIK